jgi:hypothetical protein
VDSGVRAQKRALPVPAARRRSTSVSASIQQPIESARRRVIQVCGAKIAWRQKERTWVGGWEELWPSDVSRRTAPNVHA